MRIHSFLLSKQITHRNGLYASGGSWAQRPRDRTSDSWYRFRPLTRRTLEHASRLALPVLFSELFDPVRVLAITAICVKPGHGCYQHRRRPSSEAPEGYRFPSNRSFFSFDSVRKSSAHFNANFSSSSGHSCSMLLENEKRGMAATAGPFLARCSPH